MSGGDGVSAGEGRVLETAMVMGAEPHTCTDGWKGKTVCPVSLPTVPEVTADHPRRGRAQLLSGDTVPASPGPNALSTNRMETVRLFSLRGKARLSKENSASLPSPQAQGHPQALPK